MRVIAGLAKGRPLRAVPGRSTRPTTDKVKEAMFSIIGPYFEGERVLDLFAGTGGLGIEALSRGAGSAVFIDASTRSIEVLRHNLAVTGMTEKALVYRNDAARAIKMLGKKGEAFDLVFLDPPYEIDTADQLLVLLSQYKLVQHRATAVLEHAASLAYPDKLAGFTRVRHASYGEAALSIYRFDADADADHVEDLPMPQHEGGTRS